jgi:2-haloalkanoic acid dehalogenase type II
MSSDFSLDTGWPDSVEGLKLMKEKIIIAALSNGNIRLLVDMARYAKLPWDVVLSAELFGSYKPNSQVYLGATQHLSLSPSKCAMVATHVWDLRGASAVGLKTVYVKRPNEGIRDHLDEKVKTKEEGGEVDIIVEDLIELAKIIADLN